MIYQIPTALKPDTALQIPSPTYRPELANASLLSDGARILQLNASWRYTCTHPDASVRKSTYNLLTLPIENTISPGWYRFISPTTIMMGISLPAFMGNIAPYHFISYGTLLGTTLFQTFVNTKICHSELPRSAFTTLQKRLFPVFFRCQAVLLVLTVITFPPYGPPSLIREKRDWIPLAITGLTTMANLFIYGPKTRQAMIDRIHQETRDAKRPNSIDEPSPDMNAVRRRFSFSHAMSIHLNLIGIFGMVWYGVRLASKLNIEMD